MRQSCLVLTALLGTAASAVAQVTVDLHALDALPGVKPAPAERHRAVPKPPRRVTTTNPTQVAPSQPAETRTAAPPVATTQPATPPPPTQVAPAAPPPPPSASLPAAAPPAIALAPVAPPQPTEPEAPPAPPPISDNSATAAASTAAGLRVTFGAGQSDLSPSSAAAIKQLVASAPPSANTSFNIAGYAAGTAEDPSTARRLSLSRALAVRSALMADGVSSTRIYVRALGTASGDDPPDRVDLAVLGGNASAADVGAKSQTQ